MNIYFGGRKFSAAARGASLLETVAGVGGVLLHTPCGGRRACGKCVCAVLYDGDFAPPDEFERAFIDSASADTIFERCHVPEELRCRAAVRYLCMCGGGGVSDVFLPDCGEMTIVDSNLGLSPNLDLSPTVALAQLRLRIPTLSQPIDTYENIKAAFSAASESESEIQLSFDTVCRVSRCLAAAESDEISVIYSGRRIIDAVREMYKYYFLAVDIGTTTVALSIRDAADGGELAGVVFENPQRRYGSDVISRMSYEPASVLTEVLRGAICEHVISLCNDAKISKEQIVYAVFAGNSVMQHIFSGLDAAPLAKSPFFMQTKFGFEVRANDNLCGADCYMSPNGVAYLAPLAASYVGGDVTLGVAYIISKYPEIKNKNALFMDLGTNGELCVISRGRYYFAATAAGPALEGAEIEMGMSAVDGAVCAVSENAALGRFEVSTVCGGVPIGICGSGIIDAAAAAVRVGLITQSGSICADFDELEDYESEEIPKRKYDRQTHEAMSRCVSPDAGCIYFTDKVKLTGRDIRAVQTAKAAISAGVELLLNAAGITADDLDALYLAGSFGGGINPASAAEIGIIPKQCVARGIVRPVGNTSLAGASAYALSETLRQNLRHVTENAAYIELSTSKSFTNSFISAMAF